MQTVDGIRFWRVAHLDGTTFGLDQRWFGRSGLLIAVLLVLATPSGLLSRDGSLPFWLKLGSSLTSIVGLMLTSLGHELGHAVAGRLAGLEVRAIVLGPQGGLTIRASSDEPLVNVCTALAGPLANALVASICVTLAWHADGVLAGALIQLGAIQLITSMINLLPIGRLDGAHVLAALRSTGQAQPENGGLAATEDLFEIGRALQQRAVG